MSTFNYKQIKTLNLNFNDKHWDSTTHNLVLSYNPKAQSCIAINAIPIYNDEVTDVTAANTILQQFRLNK